MQKTTSVSIGGRAFTCDQAAYDVIRKYLERCGRKLGDNPDKDEILSDIERSIADHIKDSLHDEVVSESLAEKTIKAIGEVDTDDNEDTEKKAEDEDVSDTLKRAWHRLRNIEPDKSRKILFGTAAGIGKEFDIDPFWIRVAFILITFGWGSGIFLYFIVSFLIYNKGRTMQTASELIKEAERTIQARPYEKALRQFFKVIWYSVRLVVAGIALALFMAAAIGLTSIVFMLITNPNRLSVVGAYRDWLQVVWIMSAGLSVVLPTFLVFIAAARWKKVLKAVGVMAFVWLAMIIVAVASSIANVPRLRTWAIDHNLQTPYIFVTKLNNKPIDVCFSPNGGCSILTTVKTKTNSVCSYPVYDRAKVEGMNGLRYQAVDQDWKLKTISLPQPVSDKTICDYVDKVLSDNPYSQAIFTDRPQSDVFMDSLNKDGVYVNTPTYQFDYLIADR